MAQIACWSVDKRTGTGSGASFGTTTMSYDNAGRKLGMTDMDMGAWRYRYDALGNLTSQIDARSCTTALTYDSLSRLLSKTIPAPVAQQQRSAIPMTPRRPPATRARANGRV
ncbi:MAG: RHS repeat domain-containing protein [Caldilineaceae bacterium]